MHMPCPRAIFSSNIPTSKQGFTCFNSALLNAPTPFTWKTKSPAPGPRDRHAQRQRGFGAWCRASGVPRPGARVPARAGDAALAAAWHGAIDALGLVTDLKRRGKQQARHP